MSLLGSQVETYLTVVAPQLLREVVHYGKTMVSMDQT